MSDDFAPNCPACGMQKRAARRYRKNGCDIYACKNCGVMFVFPSPPKRELLQIYGPQYFSRGAKYIDGSSGCANDPNQANNAEKLAIVAEFQNKGKLLDLGCAMGGFLACARKHGFDVTGVEVSDFCANHVKKELGIKVHNTDLLSARLPDHSFDAITMWDVIEHLPDPGLVLAEIHRILRPGGYIFITTGDAGSVFAKTMGRFWHLLTPPQHLFFFTQKGLGFLLEENGLALQKCWRPGKRATVEFVLFKLRETVGLAAVPFQWAARAAGLNPRSVYLNLYDIMVCVAKKNITSM